MRILVLPGLVRFGCQRSLKLQHVRVTKCLTAVGGLHEGLDAEDAVVDSIRVAVGVGGLQVFLYRRRIEVNQVDVFFK